jgi:hypothetical protein
MGVMSAMVVVTTWQDVVGKHVPQLQHMSAPPNKQAKHGAKGTELHRNQI